MRLLIIALILLHIFCPDCFGGAMDIPTDFPRFTVPGHEKEMASMRELYWLHYPGSSPKSTLWDEWLSAPALWPAVGTTDWSNKMRGMWNDTLSKRIIDLEGYVATHQHPSIAHPLGWPFPFWHQGHGGWGWHFSFKDTITPPWRPEHLNTTEGWMLTGADDGGMVDWGWKIKLTKADAKVTAPEHIIDTFQAPFIQLRWIATSLGSAQPYLEWTTKDQPEFSPERRFYFNPVDGPNINHTPIPLYKHPEWKGEITRLRVGFGNPQPGGEVTIQALFTQYDTRHNINSQNFIRGCASYFNWTRDLNFLRDNINRMRLAMRYVMTEHQALERKVVYTDWVGHDGRTGLQRNPDGSKKMLSGHGIGNNYWDLLPFGNLDCYATIHYYNALLIMAELERQIEAHPEWNVPLGVHRVDPDFLVKHAADVKTEGNKLFWNPETGRFIPCVDADGKIHDFGCTFLSLEAIFYDFATSDHAKSIMSWINGERTVAGDTSQGADIYHWRFAPRATTKRNIEWYFWGWAAPESIEFGDQIQDGGAVLGFTYHDLMSRLKTRGPDDTWARLQEIINWFDEVQAAGGYRKYYDGSRDGTLQGGGTCGGLGMDQEFFESVLVPQIMIDGFLGFEAGADGFSINPNLPSDWPELTTDRIRWQDTTLRIRATKQAIDIWKEGGSGPVYIIPPAGDWQVVLIADDGKTRQLAPFAKRPDGAVRVDWAGCSGVRFEKK